MNHAKSFRVLVLALLSGLLGALSAPAGFMPPQAQILSDMTLANHHFTNAWPMPGCASCLAGNHASCIWTRGTYFEGALALYRINHDPNIYNYAVKWGAFTNWNVRYGDTDLTADDQCAGQAYIELYQLDPTQTQRLTHITNNANYWMSRTNVDYWWYADALHMSMPVFAKLTALMGGAGYPARMYSYFHYAKSVIGRSNGLYNVADHLWCRDTNFLSNSNLASDGTRQKCYWSRGNGWVFAALARTLEVLPGTDAHYAEYLQTFQEMAAALKAVQRPDGFWNVNLGYANDYPGPESSGTSCFTYGMAWGINHGCLDRAGFLPAVVNGWNALANGALHHSSGSDNGFLGYEQSTGSKPSDGQPVTYTSLPNFDDFGVGLFLLAGSQVYQLSSAAGITLATPAIQGGRLQLDFTAVTTLTNATFRLLQSARLGTNWTTNAAAILTTNLSGISYRFTTTNTASSGFYRIQIQPGGN